MNSNNYVIEVKVREQGTPWEVTKGIKVDCGNVPMSMATVNANEIAKKIADAENAEVRWEFTHIGQGHYINPQKGMVTVPTVKLCLIATLKDGEIVTSLDTYGNTTVVELGKQIEVTMEKFMNIGITVKFSIEFREV